MKNFYELIFIENQVSYMKPLSKLSSYSKYLHLFQKMNKKHICI